MYGAAAESKSQPAMTGQSALRECCLLCWGFPELPATGLAYTDVKPGQAGGMNIPNVSHEPKQT